jgi:hypothetical protein
MGWLGRWRLRRAAKHYARRLGPALGKAYGASEAYTPAQIRAGVSKLALNLEFIVLGYAAFLSEDEYASAARSVPIYIPYDEARALFARFKPPDLFSASSYYESGIGMVGGADHSDHGGSP